MKKLFISQPMRGKTNDEILSERKKAIQNVEKLLGEKVEVLDSFFKDVGATTTPLWCLSESLKLMDTADIVYFAPGWKETRGCKIEHLCAVEYGIKRIE